MFALWAAVTLVALLVCLVGERAGALPLRLFGKAVASLGFVAAALAAGAPGSPWGRYILVALVLSLAGDLLLVSHRAAMFRAGLFAFLAAHLAFCAAFLQHGIDVRSCAIALAPLALVAAFVARWLLPRVDRKMRGPVVAYMVVISAMVALAAGVAPDRPLALAAAVAFFASDLSVARDRFVAPGFTNRLWGLPLYYLAQLAFAYTTISG